MTIFEFILHDSVYFSELQWKNVAATLVAIGLLGYRNG